MTLKSQADSESIAPLCTAFVKGLSDSLLFRPVRRIIGLDPALSFGWAFWDIKVTDVPLVRNSGTWKLDTPKEVKNGRDGYRFSKARDLLEEIIVPECVIFYEKAARHIGTAAAHSAGGYYAIIRSVAYENCIDALPVAVKTVKKFATGTGNATKPEMIAGVNKYLRLSGRSDRIGPSEDDRADAFAVMMLGASTLNAARG